MSLQTGVRLLTGFSFGGILAVLLCLLASQPAFAQTVDLAIQGASISPTSVAVGNTVTATGAIYNLGSAAASPSNIGFYLSADNLLDNADNLIGYSNGSSLSAGASSYRNASLTIPGGTAPGSYYILYVADYLNGIAETNENNNISSVSIAVVPPTVDFLLSNSYLNSGSVAVGGSFSISTNILNQGNSTGSSSNVGYYLSANSTFDNNDVFIGSSPGGSLPASNSRYASASLTIPANIPTGNYYIIFAADYLNGVTESNEANNTESRPISVVEPFVDLTVQYPYLSNSSAVAGASVSGGLSVYNAGNSTASSSNVGFYLSGNNTFDNNDVFIGSSSGGTLTGGNSSSRYPYITIPANTAPGAYYILFVADYLNGVTESNETNNVGSVAFNVITPVIDLTLYSLTISPNSISAGNPLSIDVTVNNQGNTSAPSGNLGFYLSANTTLDAADELLGFSNGSSLYSGGSDYRSASVTIPATTTPGNYYLIVAADYLNSISESNENNNTANAAVSITAQGTTFITPRNGSATFTTCTGKVYDNGGTANYSNNANGSITLNPATAGNKIRLTFSSLSVESCCDRLYIYDGTSTSAPLIGMYTSNPGTVYATSTSGALTLQFYTDGSVTYTGFEADIACVTTVPLPDLTMLSPTASPTSLAAGTAISVSATVSNSSTVNASSSNVGYYLSANNTLESSDVYLGSSYGSTLTAGTSAYRSTGVTIPANTAPGAYYLLYAADHQNALSEDNETNNVASVAITVLEPSVDLLLLSAFTSSSTIASGNTFTVSSFIANQGSTPASSSYVGYYLSANATYESTDIALGNSYGSMLAGGNSEQRNASLTLPATITAGNYYILFIGDFSNQVAETNETNNIRTVPVAVSSTNYMDLALLSPTLSATTILSGNTAAASAAFSNAGNTTIPRYSAAGFYLSANNTFEPSDVLLATDTLFTTLSAGSTEPVTANLTIPAGTTPGSYYILFVADYGQAFAESSETNNLSALAITVVSPAIDLLVQTPAVTPTALLPGAAFTTTAAIRNQGTVSATSSSIGYYLSANATLDAADELLGFYAGSTLAPNASSPSQTNAFQLPAATPPGAYYIVFAADHNDNISETDEANNVQAVAIRVEPALANLTFNATTVSASTIVTGDLVSVTDSLQNYGTVPANTSPVGYYLSADATFDAVDVLLGTSSGNQLANRPHSGAYKSATLTIPAHTAPGSYYLLFVADPDNQVNESNETDNIASQAITLTAPDVDLIVQNQALAPAVAAAGNQVSVSASISNQGTTPASNSAMAYYLSSNPTWESADVLLAVSAGNTLAAGSSAFRSATVTIPAQTTSGTYYLLFMGDHANNTAETNETNNVAWQVLTVSAPTSVDLVVQSPSGFPGSVAAGDQVSVSSFVYNQGVAAAGSSTVGYYLSANNTFDAADVLLGSSSGAALAAGGSAGRSGTLTIPAGTNAGSYYLLFVADHAHAEAESDETNNTGALALTVSAPAFADFTIQSPAVSPASVVAGNPVSVSATLRNQGTAAAAFSTIGYYLSADNTLDANDLLLDLAAGNGLAAGASATKSATLTIPGSTPAGSYYILFAADHDNNVAESSETNNLGSAALTVIAPTTDLMVQGQRLSPASVLPGNTLAVSADIRNQGTIAAGAGSLGYYLSDNGTLEDSDLLLGFSAGSALAAGGTASKSATLTIPANTAAGSYFILFAADHAQAEAESDETNNTVALAFTVIAPTIDLAIQAPAASVAALIAGNDLSVSATIHNSGSGVAATSPVHFYLSADATFDGTDIALGNAAGGALAAGASAFKTATLTIPANTATGNYHILFVADEALAVAESDESNNVASVALAVTAPNIDLVVQNPAVSPASVMSGNTVSVTTAIANTGNVAASASTVGYYLSTNTTLESTDIALGNSTGDALAAGAATTKTATLTIPANTAAGNYYVLFAADHAAAVTETNEANNVAHVALTVAAPTGPDLVAAIPSVPTANMVKGNVYTVSATITNRGTANSSTSNAGFYLSADDTFDNADTFLAAATGNGLAVNGYNTLSANITIPQGITPGTYKLFAVADYLNSVAEVNEANNTNYYALTVQPPVSNLEMRSVAVAKNSLTPGEATTVTGVVSNTGNTNYAGGMISYYLSADTTFGSSDVLLTELFTMPAAGQTETKTGPITIPANTAPGAYYILALADRISNYTETNEADNVSYIAITAVAPVVDLLIQSPSATAASVPAGTSVNSTITIANLGNTAAASSNFGFYLSTDNTWEASDAALSVNNSAGPLAAGSSGARSIDMVIPVDTPPGNYYMLIVADNFNAERESNEANNVSSLALAVTAPTSALSFTPPVTITPNPVTAGSSITAAANVGNGGTVAKTVIIDYYLSPDNNLDTLGTSADVLLGTYRSASPLNGLSGTSTTQALTIPAATVGGNYYIIFRMDPTASKPTNYQYAVAISINPAPLPDLGFDAATIQETTIAAGGSINTTVRTRNLGPGLAPGYTIGYFLSADNTLDASDLLLSNYNFSSTYPGSGTSIGGNYLPVPAGTAVGNYYLLFVLDYHNVIAEGNETDNVRAVAITITTPTPPVPLPDLVVGLATFSATPSAFLRTAGDTLATRFTVRNVGTRTAGTSYVGYYFSSKATVDSTATFLGRIAVDSVASGKESPAHAGIDFIIPNNLTPGPHYLLLQADHAASVAESSEANNIRVVYLYITGAGSDLRVSNLTLSATTLPAGGATTTAKPWVSNYGTTPTATSKVNFYLSDDYFFGPTDVLLSSSDGGTLSANQQVPLTVPLTIPAGTPPGRYAIIAKVDPDNTVSEAGETGETNNIMFATIKVGETDLAFAPGSPGFVHNLTTNTPIPAGTPTVAAGDRLETSLIIKHSGTVSVASGRFSCFLSSDSVYNAGDVLINNYSSGLPTLFPTIGDNYYYPLITIPANSRTGAYYLLFMLDKENIITETDETNNMRVLPINVTGPPLADLVLQAPAASPAAAPAGARMTLAATLVNTGEAEAAASTLRFYLSGDTTLDSTDVALGNTAAAALAASDTLASTAVVTLPANTAMGNYHILFVADADSTIIEENELNNIQSIPFKVGAVGKDLIVRLHTVTPDSMVAGSAMPVTAKIFNRGVEAAASSKTGIYLSADQALDDQDTLIGSGTGDSLAALTEADRNFGFTIPLRTAAGNYYLIYKVDNVNEVTESNEDNNTLAEALTITAPPLPDITITTAAPVVASALAGGSVTVKATIKNQGTVAIGPGTISYYLSADNTYEAADVLAGSSTAAALAAGAEVELSVNLAIPAQTAPGNYYLLALADQAGRVTESDETNNIFAFAFTVAAPAPDLTLQSPALSAATVARGSVLTATATLANVGTGPANAGKVQYYLSANDSFESSDVLLGESDAAALAAGASSALSAALTIPATTVTGDYFVLLVADATGLNAESNEANNGAHVAVAVSVANGIKDLEASYRVTVAPNPAPEQVRIAADKVPKGVRSAELTLFDITGSKVLHARSALSQNALRAQLDVRHLSQGTYLLHIRIGQEVVFRKIVIAR